MAVIMRSKADKPWIEQLKREIAQNVSKMTIGNIEKFLEAPVVTDVSMYNQLPNSKSHYMVWDKKLVGEALKEFFTGYTLDRLAEESYYTDIGDKFTESMLYDEALGVVLKKGQFVPSYELEIEFCALPFWEDTRILGMPFKVTNIRLVDIG